MAAKFNRENLQQHSKGCCWIFRKGKIMVKIYKTKLDDEFNLTVLRETAPYGDGRKKYSAPALISGLVNDVFDLQHESTENLVLVGFNTGMHIKGITKISTGTVNKTVCSPRDIFQKALLMDAVNIAIVHNHPSGDVTPSSDDARIAERIMQTCDLLEVKLVDSIIVANGGRFYSFAESGILRN